MRWNRNGRAVLRLVLRYKRELGQHWTRRLVYALTFLGGGEL